uniref:hypothetical protein n=1 Tax=Sulfolobus sp. NOB8H2 TaxID=84600 RepID=UPI0000062748|nr:hypothetical protein [Sulfolobus sp. NOB8H2]CAA09159.1 hypothetical protein [Sulfolobus sp. NOB8H2]
MNEIEDAKTLVDKILKELVQIKSFEIQGGELSDFKAVLVTLSTDLSKFLASLVDPDVIRFFIKDPNQLGVFFTQLREFITNLQNTLTKYIFHSSELQAIPKEVPPNVVQFLASSFRKDFNLADFESTLYMLKSY